MAGLRSLLALWLILISGAAGLAAPARPSWAVRAWQSDDGLPNNIVSGLAQTQDGYLWVANPTRLARFDGIQFEEFPATSLLRFNQRIVTLAAAHDGALWMATDHGVVAQVKAGVVQVFTNNLPALLVESMAEDGEGAIWVKSRGGDTICRIYYGQVTQMPMAGSYRSVAVNAQGKLWYVNNGEVGVYRHGQFEELEQLGKTGSGRLACAKNGGAWICLGSELFKYAEGAAAVSLGKFNAQTAGTEPTVMLEDRHGAVWIGTSDSGLFRFEEGTFENIPVSHRQILSLLEDREGNIWAGTGGGGLDRIQPRVVALEGMESSLPFEAVQSLCQDANGIVWAATQNGLLVCRTNGVWLTVSGGANWPGGRAACVAADKSGAVWIGTRNHRLYCLREGRFNVFGANAGLASRTLHVLLPAANGDLWLSGGGPNSVQRLHDGRFDTISIPGDLQTIHSMVEDAESNIWVGTSKGVLLRIRNGVVTDETARNGTGLMSIRCLQTTADGSLWIGYAGSGLGRLKNGRYTRITVSRGLFDDHVSQIIADGRGWLWIGCEHGIFKVRQQQLDAFADGKTDHVLSMRYGPGEGLSGLQANVGDCPDVLRGADGRLWMPMRTALAVINPNTLSEDATPPSALLKQMMVDDRVVAQYGGPMPATGVKIDDPRDLLKLPPNHLHLEFNYTAMSFNTPDNVRFQYQLQGYDDAWVEGGTERHASYSRLAAGSYRFLVRACNSDGIWGRTTAGLAFAVAPFFWQTWWFWCGALLAFALAVALVVRYVSHRSLQLKVQTLERQAALDRERTRIARDIHDDIGNLLTQATLLSSLTLRDRTEPEKTGEHARQISTTVEQVTKSLDEIVWAVNPRNDTLPQLIDYIGQFAVEFMQTAGIPCRMDLPDHPPHRAISTDVRHNLFLVVKEALNNVARHSGAREVSLRVAATDENLQVTIHDNGHGFDPALVNGSSNGLNNMRQRIAELGGDFQLESRPRQGTQIRLQVPWPQRS